VIRVGHASERCAHHSGVEIGDPHARRNRSEATQVVRVARGDDRSSSQVCIRDQECVNGHLRSGTDRSEQLAGAYTDTRVHRVDFHPVPAKAGEQSGVSRSAPNDLGQDRSNSRDRQLPRSHLGDQGPDTIASMIGTVSDCRDRLAVEQQHSASHR